ncbi:MAG: hypothetical protein RMJ37_05650 [Spirochaetia bacterium]|nr:hypothetical protein [Spirochaetota bacterium]MDW8112802.1 hypothetical protein [Spirochaetia bacterium]
MIYKFICIVILSSLILHLISCSTTVNPGATNTNTNTIVKFKLYVSKTGNDSNNGSSTSPYFSIHKAISKAYEILSSTNGHVEIMIEEGLYKIDDGLSTAATVYITNRMISLAGGYNSDFSEVVGYSIIDVSNSIKQAIVVENATNITISGIILRNGKTYSSSGGGMYIRNSIGITITNVEVSSNSAINAGGMYVENVKNSKFFIKVITNNSLNVGGGIVITNSSGLELQVEMFNNVSVTYGGAIVIANSSNITLKGTITNNSSAYGGGVAILGTNSRGNTINGDITLNTGTTGGGGIFISNANTNTISANLQGNRSPRGGGVYIANPVGQIVISESIITNIDSTGSQRSCIFIHSITPNISLIIDKCLIGGTTSSTVYGIYEDGSDITGHIITFNTFYASTIYRFYRDQSGTEINNINTLNNSLNSDHDAITVGNSSI